MIPPSLFKPASDPSLILSWVPDKNLLPFLQVLATFVGYPFDDADWGAIEVGLPATDGDKNLWFEYHFSQDATVRLWLAKDHGTSVVLTSIGAPQEVRPKIEAALFIFQTFSLRRE